MVPLFGPGIDCGYGTVRFSRVAPDVGEPDPVYATAVIPGLPPGPPNATGRTAQVEEAIREACAVFALAYHSIGDYSQPVDGFCDKCPATTDPNWGEYRNYGHIFDFVRQAVLAHLRRHGYSVDEVYDSATGRPVEDSP